VAGTGTAGVLDHPDAFRARFSDPFGVAVDADGTIFVTDGGDAHRIRRISPRGGVVTIAGGEAGFVDGRGAEARFNTPSGLALSADGALIVADTVNNTIRRVTRDGVVTTMAGDGVAGYVDGPARTARFNGPIGIAVDAAQRVIVADTYNDRIRAIEPDGSVMTVAGDGRPGYVDGPAGEARFNTPCGVSAGADGTIYIADTGNDAVRIISPSGLVGTLWTSPPGGLYRPTGIAIDDRGILYVTDERGIVVEIRPNVGARALAGTRSGLRDGAGEEARFRGPSGLAIAGPQQLVVADRRNAAVRLIAAPSALTLRLPSPPRDTRVDAPARPTVPLLWPLAPFEGPHEITGTLGEARGSESERLHAGLDVHAVEGTIVHAVRGGVVSDPVATAAPGTLNESIRIGRLAYVHLRAGRHRRDEPFEDTRFVHTFEGEQLVHTRVKRGARFTSGEPIGTVNRFSHVHLNVGWPGQEINPLEYGLVQFADTVPPTIRRGGIRLFREDGQPLTERKNRRVIVSGRVRIVVDAWDQVNGNARRRRLGLYRLGYQVLNRDGTPVAGFDAPRETIRFDRLAPEPDAARIIYSSGSGIPEYGRRSTHFLYVVTSRLRGGVAAADAWDADALPPGDYLLRIIAADISGNEATANRDLPITIGVPAVAAASR
jgi:sugar lactone lactonase YvrE